MLGKKLIIVLSLAITFTIFTTKTDELIENQELTAVETSVSSDPVWPT
ncbi:MAG: hypothetical protein U9Q88_00310 [Bacillota bacterium]|nr:hypothetical protein [Bacillota bacterium]